MRKFVYKAWNKNFDIVKGTIEDERFESVVQKLKARELKIISINEKNGFGLTRAGRKMLKEEDIAGFCGQIGTIISSGVSIIKGLEVLEMQTKNKKFKEIIRSVLEGVRSGEPLGKSMESTGTFPKLLTDMITSGEISGNIDTVLFNMENFYQREANIKNKIKNSSIYPAVILLVAVIMLAFFNFYFLPAMKDLFSDTANLPWITRILISSTAFISNNPVIILAIIAFAAVVINYLLNIDRVKLAVDHFLIKVPVIGPVKLDIITSRFTRSMAIFMKSAVPIFSILDNIQLTVDNKYISSKIEIMKSEIINGNKIGDAIESQNIFEPIVTQMIRVGEETGKLEETLFKLADIYDKKVETGIGRLMSLVEPAFTLVVGLIVGTVILAVAMPVMQMTSNMR